MGICSSCFLKVDCCPQCQASYPLGEEEGEEMQETAEDKTNGHGGAIKESPSACRRNVLSCFNIQVPAGIPPHIAQSAAELYDVEMKHMGEAEFEEFMKDWSPHSPMYLYLRELRSKVR